MENIVMPYLSSIGFSITSKCPIACSHCIIEAGPHRKEEMSLDDAYEWIQLAAAYQNGHIQSIVFTGGEPFYIIEQLKKMLEFAFSCGLVPAVATNAFWATSFQDALKTLQYLPQIKMLTLSTDIYHQRFIPLKYVKNAILACKELNIAYNIAITIESENDTSHKDIIKNLEKIVDKKLINISTIIPAGRALKTVPIDRLPKTAEPPVSACVFGADSPTIFPDGKVIGCMAIVMDLPKEHPLLLGNLKEKSLDQILDDAEMNAILHIIRIWGSQRLIKMLQDSSLRQKLPKEYLTCGYCDFCYALISDKELLKELMKITDQQEILEKTAYARLYYLQETMMIEKMEKNGLIKD